MSGRPTLRDASGERELEPGDCVLFASGPSGAHQIINRADKPTRVLFESNLALTRGADQPDSGKMKIG